MYVHEPYAMCNMKLLQTTLQLGLWAAAGNLEHYLSLPHQSLPTRWMTQQSSITACCHKSGVLQ